jgi:hypothetical protein
MKLFFQCRSAAACNDPAVREPTFMQRSAKIEYAVFSSMAVRETRTASESYGVNAGCEDEI